MKKREIINLIDLNKKVLENEKYQNIVLPEFDEIEDELDILKVEIEEGIAISKEALVEIKKCNCNHSVRLNYPGCLGYSGGSSECVFCGKSIDGDCYVYGNTIYEDVNRNRYCVNFMGNYFYDDEMYVNDAYDKSDVYEILLKILECKNDDDEIDFVQEIKKLNIEKCQVDERRKEKIHYILIVGGSNKYSISEGHYITCDRIPISTNLTQILREIPGVRLEVFENEDTIKDIEILKSRNTRFVSYKTIQELMNEINKEKNVPFDVIIDISSLYEYSVIDGTIISKKNDINLKEIFPNSYVIKIDDFGNKSKKELLEILREKLLIYNETYSYIRRNGPQFGNMNDDDFYVLKDDKIAMADINDAYKNIRKVLLKR